MALVFNGLVKLIEEAGELQQAAAKKIAYFDTDKHPDGKGSLKERLEDEIADVIAAATFVEYAFDLDIARIEQRTIDKLDLYNQWHKE